MRHKVTVTKETLDALRADSWGKFHSDATRRPDGLYELPLAHDVYERLRHYQHLGESMNDAILRLLNTAGRKLQ